jgi:DNA sulfur modification protein DndE
MKNMKIYLPVLLFLLTTQVFSQKLPVIQQVSFKKDSFNILKFGAKSDGFTLNSDPINNAIKKCSANGGGVVVIPAGLWLTGPIRLQSNVNLYVAKGAVVQFTDDTNQYPLIETSWEGVDAIRAHSPLYGIDLENIAITGAGILDGAGQAWRPVKKNKLTPPEWKELVASGGFLNEAKDTWYPTERALIGSTMKRPGVVAEGFDFQKSEEIKEFLRPNMLSLIRCKKVLLEGITFQNSPAWCLHPLLSQHLTIKNITVRNPWNAQNGDGLDIESCRYVLVENSVFDVGDDGICIKSGRDEEGRKRGVPTEDVIVRNCTVYHGHGGFVVGSEMSGGARNLFVYDCNFLGTDIGIRFKTTRGRGGVVEKVFIRNIRMNNIGGAAILFDMYYMAKDPLAMFSGGDAPAIEFQPVTEATPQFKDILIQDVACKGAETAIFVRGLPEMNIRNITMENINIQSKKGFECIEGDGITLKNALLITNSDAVVQTQNSKNILLDNVKFQNNPVFLKVTGDRSTNLKVMNTDVTKAAKDFDIGAEVPKNAITKK